VNRLPVVATIIQARMCSSRLPGKVLMDISGAPMLARVIERCRAARLSGTVIVATSTGAADDRIAGFCAERGIECFRGDECDVLDRYYQAMVHAKADVVVRVTSDCPLIDPAVIDAVIGRLIDGIETAAAASNVVRRSFPRGLDVEAVTAAALAAAWHLADSPAQREHVTRFLYERPELFRILSVEQGEDLSGLRWTVDEERDLEFMREIYGRLGPAGSLAGMQEVTAILSRDPALTEINRDVQQKKV
jgi:spore coat polysaccharide biosynthesis protein SpsF